MLHVLVVALLEAALAGAQSVDPSSLEGEVLLGYQDVPLPRRRDDGQQLEPLGEQSFHGSQHRHRNVKRAPPRSIPVHLCAAA